LARGKPLPGIEHATKMPQFDKEEAITKMSKKHVLPARFLHGYGPEQRFRSRFSAKNDFYGFPEL